MVRMEPPATRDWQFPRSMAGVALLAEEGAALGVDPTRVLRGSGIAPDDLADHRGEVTAAQELRVIRNVHAAAPQLSGVRVGMRYHASTFGVMGFAMLSSATLGDAANLALRFIDLSHSFSIPAAEVHGGVMTVTLHDTELPADVRRFLLERDLAAVWTVLRELGGGRPEVRAVTLPFAPGDPAGYDEVFGRQPARGDRAGFEMAAAWLDLELMQANPHALAVSEALCRELVSRRRGHAGLAAEVRVLIAQRIGDGAPMRRVADDLGLSERSLRRRLTEEGTSYRALLDQVRQDLAADLLTTGHLDVEDVALRLGYAEASSFILAHRRWTGHTPRGGEVNRDSR